MNDEPIYDSMDAFVLAERRANEARAAEAARWLVAQLAADGLNVAPGMEEAVCLRVLNMLNDQLDGDQRQIEERLAGGPDSRPAPLH